MGKDAGAAARQFFPRAFINLDAPADAPQQQRGGESGHRAADNERARRGRSAQQPGAPGSRRRKHADAFHRQHRRVVLVAHGVARAHDAAVGAAARLADVGDSGAGGQHIAGAHRVRPADFVDAGRAHAGAVAQQTVDEKPHEQRNGVPTAGDQPAIDRTRRGRFVDVEGLGVEHAREGDDFIAGDGALSEVEFLSRCEVLQIAHHATR